MKLRNLLIFLFIIISLISNAVGGWLLYFSNLRTVEDRAGESQLAIVESRSGHIKTYLGSLQGRMADFSSDGKIKACTDDINKSVSGCSKEELIEHLIINKLPAVEGLSKVFILGLEGKIVASSNRDDVGADKKNEPYFLANREDHPFIQIVFSGAEKKILVSAPIYKETGHKEPSGFLGFIVGEIDTTELKKIITSRVGLGETGEVVAAIHNKGKISYLFERLFEQELADKEGAVDEPMKQALFGNESVFIKTLDYRSKSVVAATQYIEMVDMGLVAKIDRFEIVAKPAAALARRLIIFGFISFSMAFIIGWTVALFISRPLDRLVNGAKAIGKGNLKYKIYVKTKNEIGALAEAFNVMADKLADLYENLEEKVKQRTAEADEKNKKLLESESKLKKILNIAERTNKLMVGRELKIVELKKENKKLKQSLDLK